ncbi:PRD domain-containing protein [Romboutsia weinsteinii]|uniref:PRD domain-containing protein n=1 Tax=Romboutsia weinsteinii TaxID=2020949 RepID=A0A371J2U4_9FIRM|nr:BglG family transcription antiterminator [Romboutsia weinsteinii]RDY27122.1 PRD domain-containing protein [Romboutsia weinsteinii]
MNKRQEDLLTILLAESDYIDTNQLAEKLECSERTVRNNCKDINEWLSSFCSVEIKRKSNLGVKLVGEDCEKNLISQKLRREVKRGNSEIHKQIEILKLILLNSTNKINFNEMCNKLYTNKNTLREEINKLSNKISEYDLEINIKKNSGMYVDGSEKNIRIMLVDFLFKYIDTYRLNIEEIDSFHAVDIIVIKNIMNNIEDRLNTRFTDTSFKQLMLFLLIGVIRVRIGNSLNENMDNEDIKLGELIEEIDRELKSNLCVNINQCEKNFISSLILSMNREISSDRVKENLRLNTDLVNYTKRIIKIVSDESGINFMEDELLFDQLLCHINATLQQIKNNVNLQNPLLDDIKTKYCFLFTVISNAIRSEGLHNDITEDELGYLVLHFQVSLERKSNKRDEMKKASIVCPLSFGVSTLLKVKIEKRLNNIEIIETIREEDLKRNNFNKNIDFIIGFQEYENIDLPFFITTPLFTGEDENRLKLFVNKVKIKETSYKIMNKLMISDYLIKELDYTDVFETIEYLATVLANKHYVEKEYVNSVIDREKTYPTNIGNGILLPHGDIKYVKQSILSFTRLKNPIKIKNGQTIKFIIMLAYRSDDRAEFQELFKEISQLTEDKEMMKKMSTCKLSDIKKILI